MILEKMRLLTAGALIFSKINTDGGGLWTASAVDAGARQACGGVGQPADTRPPGDVPVPGHGVAWTLERARAQGVAPHRLRSGRFRRPHRNVYVSSDAADDLGHRCAALGLVLPPEARFSHRTAAALYGAPTPASATASDLDIHLTVPAGVVVPRRRPGVVTHQRVLDADAVVVDGVPVTCPEQTFLDLAAVTGRRELVVLGDFLVRDWTTPDAIVTYLAARPRTRGIVRAREAAGLVRLQVDSPQETRLRLLIVDAGLPEPEVNRPAFDEAGEWIGIPDLGYHVERIAVQHDGEVHWSNVRRWRQDVVRDEAFRDAGWIVLRTVAEDVRQPARFLTRLTRSLRERGWRPEPS
jgi:hypothetical protein